MLECFLWLKNGKFRGTLQKKRVGGDMIVMWGKVWFNGVKEMLRNLHYKKGEKQ